MFRLTLFTAVAVLLLPVRSTSGTPRDPLGYDLLPEATPRGLTKRARAEAIRRARVWLEPPIPIEEADLFTGNDPFFRVDDVITCDYLDSPLRGSVPKFLCRLETGEIVKIKYGDPDAPATREIPAEVAASRLLRVLGFGADRMYLVRKVKCRGCSRLLRSSFERDGHPSEKVRSRRRSEARRSGIADVVEFDWVSVERRMEGKRIQTKQDEGWSWRDDLPRVDTRLPASSSRAELDAFRLIATFLESVDSKSSNQRLMCLPGGHSEREPTLCVRPFMMIHDLGATFGKPGVWSVSGAKFKLGGWRRQNVWKDPGSCTTRPAHGFKYTFDPYPISEAGRLFLADLLNRLSLRQITDLFRGARAEAFPDSGTEDFEVRALLELNLRHRSEAELLEVFDVSAVTSARLRAKDDVLTIGDVQDARLRNELRLLAWTTVFEEKRTAINTRNCGR